MTKYVDLISPIVNVHINNMSIPNNLIDLGVWNQCHDQRDYGKTSISNIYTKLL
jgi:hypothetical protein